MSEPAAKSTRANVLIVEDSSVFREMQSLLLRQAGYAISAHEHPNSALEAAKARAYDLVVVDYELPGMNGEEFMHALRKFRPEIAVVFVSGSLTLELAIRLGQQSVAGIFHKPVNPKILLEKINEIISRSSAGGKGSNSPLPAARRGNSNAPVGTNPPFPLSEPGETTSATRRATFWDPRMRFAVSPTASGACAISAPSCCCRANRAVPSNRSPATWSRSRSFATAP